VSGFVADGVLAATFNERSGSSCHCIKRSLQGRSCWRRIPTTELPSFASRASLRAVLQLDVLLVALGCKANLSEVTFVDAANSTFSPFDADRELPLRSRRYGAFLERPSPVYNSRLVPEVSWCPEDPKVRFSRCCREVLPLDRPGEPPE